MSELTDMDKIKIDYAVLIGAYDQVRWERDTAIDQLREIGKDFGAKMDDVAKVVRCKDCKFHRKGRCALHGDLSFCSFYVYDDFFCAEGKRKEGGQND